MKKRMIELVMLLLVVLITSCDVNQPHEEIEQEPEKPEMISAFILAPEIIDGDTVRVENATIIADGGDYNQRAISTNGIFDERLIAKDVDVEIYAYAEGYKSSDTLTVNLSSNVREVLILEKEETPDPKGPGKLEIIAESCKEDSPLPSGILTVRADNGFKSIKLIDAATNEVVRTVEGLSPVQNQEYTFTDIPNGEYKLTATLEDDAPTSTTQSTVVDCQALEGPGKVSLNLKSCADPDSDNGSLSGTVENGADMVTLKRGGSAVDEIEDVQPGEEFIFAGFPVGDYEVVAKKNDIVAPAFRSITECDQPEPPTARFSTQANFLKATFDGSGSSSPNGDIVEWAWDFNSDGTYDEEAPGPIAEFEYSEAGRKTITLRVTDKLGLTNKTTRKITVEKEPDPNQDPEAKFSFTTDGLTASFDASGSSDSDGDVVSYSWEFGDGTTGSGITPDHTYDEEGTYSVTLTVTDNEGATDEITKDVTVERPNRKPDVKFTIEDKDYLTVTFKNRSSDPDGDNLSCTWNFGDGGTSTEKDPVYTYSEAGEYTVVLTCQDPDGASDSYEKTITVEKEPDPNQDPEAKFSFTTDGLTASFDASGSSDSDGDVVSYSWEFGDGTTGSGITPDHTYDEEGTYSVTLTVTDNEGATDEITKDVTVTVILSDEYKHRITFGGNRDIWVSDHQNRPIDDLLTYGEVRPIRTDKDPYGDVKVKLKFKLDADQVDTENSFLKIYYESDESDAFSTPIFLDKPGVDGWTTATVTVDASNFAGKAKKIAGVKVVHGDEIDDSKPAGPDDVYFSTEDTEGTLWFCWRVQISGQQKMLTLPATEWHTDNTVPGSPTEVIN